MSGRNGGTVEHCQHAILDQNNSGHRTVNGPVVNAGGKAATTAATTTTTPTPKKNSKQLPLIVSGGGSGMHKSNSGGSGDGMATANTGSGMPQSSPYGGSSHGNNGKDSPVSPHPTEASPLLRSLTNANSVPSLLECYDNGFRSQPQPAVPQEQQHTIRFQVVVWHIGQIDMVQGRVECTFRVTLFWNALPDETEAAEDLCSVAGTSQKTHQTWRMHGRQKAFQTDVNDIPATTVDVPPVSILNVVTFDTIGAAEVSLLREDTRLMRWSCMYRAMLCNDNWQVDNFPHDEHEISLRLAILAHRQPGSQWDRAVWKLALATAEDSQGSVRIPHGLVVDHVSIPEFRYHKETGLQFSFTSLEHGPGGGSVGDQDACLKVTLRVVRNAAYYDRNIMPLLGMLNFVAITITALEAQNFFERALLTLNIAFVEIGMRMTADSKLPTASYQIKMQRILNEYFFGLLFIVLESLLVYELHEYGFSGTGILDALAALAVFSHNLWTLYFYYADAALARSHVPLVKRAPEELL